MKSRAFGLGIIVGIFALWGLAAWDPAKPADSSASLTADVRANWTALQQSTPGGNTAWNGELWNWSAGAAAAPDGFVLAGAGCTVARAGAGEADTYTFGAGPYAAKVTRVGTNCTLTYTVISTGAMSLNTAARGKLFSAGAMGKTSTASHLRLTIDDGISTSSSAYHAGDGVARYFSVSRTLDASATKVTVVAEVNGTNAAAYVGGLVASWTDVPPTQWAPAPGRIAWPTSRIYGDSTARANSGANETVMGTYPLPPVLDTDGRTITVRAWGTTVNNANAKNCKAYFGATASAALGFTGSAVNHWLFEWTVMRTGAATQTMHVDKRSYDGSAYSGRADQLAPIETLTGFVTLKLGCTGGASSDITQKGFAVWLD